MTEVENMAFLNGYHGGLKSDVPVKQLQKCSENEIDMDLSLDNTTSLNSDPSTILLEVQQAAAVGNYHLDNMYGCDCSLTKAREVQLKQPAVNFSGGKGWIGEKGCLVENDTNLRFPGLTNKKYINQFQNINNQGFFGKGSHAVDTESILRDSQMTRIDRSCNVLSGSSTLEYSITPMINKLEKEVQNPKNIIQEDSLDSWIRGGIPSRQVARNIDFIKRCDQKRK